MYWTWNDDNVVDNWASWHISHPVGDQEVFAFIPWDNATTSNARYRVGLPNETSPTYVVVNQNNYYGEWVSLGLYSFGSETVNWISLSDLTYEAEGASKVGFDALAMVPATSQWKAFLPSVNNNYNPQYKLFSGIHLGNRTADWPSEFLTRIDPARGGQWPSAVIALSSQIYRIVEWPRGGINSCRVWYAEPNPAYPVLWDYIKRAGQAGVKIIIRLFPSPGNFQDWHDPQRSNHHLDNGPLPAGGDWCNRGTYRSYVDLADEMGVIHNLNLTHGFTEYGFEPSNEPNREWYVDPVPSIPAIHDSIVWEEMDTYFSSVYSYVKNNINSSIRVLTPSMTQFLYAELINMADYNPEGQGICEPMVVSGGGSGYEKMPNTFGSLTSNGNNDGVTWHNYWYYTKEAYATCPDGQHVYLHFPVGMKSAMIRNRKPTFITEADLSSSGYQGLTDKDHFAYQSAESIRQFIWTERAFNGVNTSILVWNINDNTTTVEHSWHEAYLETGYERRWFPLWWTSNEYWP